MSDLKFSAPQKADIPLPSGGGGKALGALALQIEKLDVGFMIEVEGATGPTVSSASNAAAKRLGRKFAVRKTNKVVDTMPVYGVWRLA